MSVSPYKESNLIKTLQDFLHAKSLVSIDKNGSNFNQYFKWIKDKGINLDEVWKPNKNNKGRHKLRRLVFTAENIKRAEDELKRLGGYVPSRSNESKKS